jgi:hypothetical protein
LYDVYAKAVAADCEDARQLKWTRAKSGVVVAIGTSGVLLLVVEQAVKTAFLPGHGDPEATVASREAGVNVRGLPREKATRSGRGHDDSLTAKELEQQRKREAMWTPEELLYYRVFKRSLQFIKRSHHRSRDMFGRLASPCDWALLKDVLPARNQLKYAQWAELRRQCRRRI